MKKKNNANLMQKPQIHQVQKNPENNFLKIVTYIVVGFLIGLAFQFAYSKYITNSVTPPTPKENIFAEKIENLVEKNENNCSKEYVPVCGNDGNTYDNACLAGVANQSYTPGKCKDDEMLPTKPCTREYDPVCWEDGKDYPNRCVAESFNVEIKHSGTCENSDKTAVVEDSSVVAITTNNDSKDSELEKIENVLEKNSEKNQVAIVCTKEYKPVCWEDGKEYGNKCLAESQNVKIKNEGKCETQKEDTTFDPAKNHIYENNWLKYGFAMPNYSYYQGFGAVDGAVHTMAVGLDDKSVESLENADVKILLYKNDSKNTPKDWKAIKVSDDFTAYVIAKPTDNPKLQKIITTLEQSVHKN